MDYRFHHLGIPIKAPIEGMIRLPHLKVQVTDHESNPFGIQWMYFEDDSTYPKIVQELPHAAFEMDDLYQAIAGKKVIIPPNSPTPGVLVAFIEEVGAPVELLQILSSEES
jgi:hypothetical protein